MEGTAGKKSYINWILMAVNALFFLYLQAAGSSEDAYFMYTKGAMLKAAVMEDGEYYRLLTAMFMHFGIGHLVNNMIVLFALGDNLERALGHVKYLILYLFSGIGANWIPRRIPRINPATWAALSTPELVSPIYMERTIITTNCFVCRSSRRPLLTATA